MLQPMYQWDELYRCYRIVAWPCTAANTVSYDEYESGTAPPDGPAMRAEDDPEPLDYMYWKDHITGERGSIPLTETQAMRAEDV